MDLNQFINDARTYCELLVQQVHSSADDVIWFQAPDCKGDVWHVVQGAEPSVESNSEMTVVLSQTFFMCSLRKKLLELGREKFNVSQSLPACDGLTKWKWPGPSTQVRKLWILPTSPQKGIEQLIDEVKDLWRDESIIVYGFPLAFEFCINVLYVIGHLFNKVGIVYPKDSCALFLFYGFRKWDVSYERLLTQIRSIMNKHELHNLSILSKIPASSFYDSKFFYYCLCANCIHVKGQVLHLLDNIEAAEKKLKCAKGTEMLPKQVSHDYEGCCSCSNCVSRRVAGSSGDKSSIICNRVTNELEHLSLYVNQIGVEWSPKEDVTWLFPETPCPAPELIKKTRKNTHFHSVEISKFCSKQLLVCQRKLCEMFKQFFQMTDESTSLGSCLLLDLNVEIVTTMTKYSWSESPLEVKLLDFGIELWMNLEEHAKYQSDTLQRIMIALQDTWKNECLELRGFPLLSEFNVSLIFLLSQLFKKVGFYHTPSGRNAIVFISFQHFPENVKQHLEGALGDVNLVSLVPLNCLFCGKFYEKVRNFNNVSMKKHCLHMMTILS